MSFKRIALHVGYVVNAYLAAFYYLASRKANKDIWIVGAFGGQLYGDNAMVLHQYIGKAHPNVDVYWACDVDSPAWNAVQSKKLKRGSFSCYLTFYRARACLFSHTLNSDIVPWLVILPFLRNFYRKCFKVYVGHGSICLGKMPKYGSILGRFKSYVFSTYDLAVAATCLEKTAMQSYGIKASSIVLAGSARNDVLVKKVARQPFVFISPRWRSQLYNMQSLRDSEFYYYYSSLLLNEQLHALLRRYGIKLCFYLHHMFHGFYHEFKPLENDVIEVLTKDANLSDYNSSADLLITDYSSVSADFYYLQKPVIFYQFDQREFIHQGGAEIDVQKDIFGHVVKSESDLIEALADQIEAGFYVTDEQRRGQKFFVNFRDRNNCERILEAILSRVSV